MSNKTQPKTLAALKLVTESGKSVRSAAKECDIDRRTINRHPDYKKWKEEQARKDLSTDL